MGLPPRDTALYEPPPRATRDAPAPSDAAVVDVRGLSRSFGPKRALADVSLTVARGEVHALLGPNGAGKTTLLRALMGLVGPTSGRVRVLGRDVSERPRDLHRLVGLVPSQERTFYERVSGLENLRFFARLHGLRSREAVARARAALVDVGLEEAADRRVGEYSHGMKKRLGMARALLSEPALLLVDEATHDLDPAGATRVRALARAVADRGAAVVWATQRIEEIRGLADGATLLRLGEVRFSGTVPALMALAGSQRYVLRLRASADGEEIGLAPINHALRGLGTVAVIEDDDTGEHHALVLGDAIPLSDAVLALAAVGLQVVSCREERSSIEDAFLALTEEAPR